MPYEQNLLDKLITNGNGNPRLSAWVIIAAFVGGGSGLGSLFLNDPRPDPFTGTQARQMEARLTAAIAEIKSEFHEHETRPYHTQAGIEISILKSRCDHMSNTLKRFEGQWPKP